MEPGEDNECGDLHVLDVLLVPPGGHVVLAGLGHGHLVEDGEHQPVQQHRVQRHQQPRRLVTHDEPDQGENHLKSLSSLKSTKEKI